VLQKAEADQVRGRGFPTVFDDAEPERCPSDEAGREPSDPDHPATAADPGQPGCDDSTCNGFGAGATGSAAQGTGGGGLERTGSSGISAGDCGTCGMAAWRVTEPHIALWIVDTPVFYTKSYGNRQTFQAAYKQRNARSNANGFGFGPSWECNRLSYVDVDASGAAKHWVANGGARVIPTPGFPEYKTQARYRQSNDAWGNPLWFEIDYANGARAKFALNNAFYDGSRHLWLTEQVDRFNRTNTYLYTTNAGKV
jgi:hypothetical protein